MKNALKRTIGFLLALMVLGGTVGCATDTEVGRTKLPGVDKPATQIRTGN